MSSEFSEIQARFETFIEECEWRDYHTPKRVCYFDFGRSKRTAGNLPMVRQSQSGSIRRKVCNGTLPLVSVLTLVDGVTCRHHRWTVRRIATMLLVALPGPVGATRGVDPVRARHILMFADVLLVGVHGL